MTPWLLAPCVVRLAPVSSRQMPYIRSLHGKCTWEAYNVHLAGVACGLSGAPGARVWRGCFEPPRSRLSPGTRRRPDTHRCPLAGIGSWVVRAGRADCHGRVYRRNPAARGGTGRAARPTIAAAYASISPEVRPVGHGHRNAVEHVYQACFELLFPAVLGQPGRKAVHRGETPGVDVARRVD
jgi:hypothetical protein